MLENRIDVNLLNPFIRCTIEVFNKMMRLKINKGGMRIKNDSKMFGDYSGVIGLAGSASGAVIFSLPNEFAVQAVAKMLYLEPDELTEDDVEDGVGEIINMIAGSAKSSFSGTEFSFDIGLPNVVKGKSGNYEINHKKGVPCFEFKFDCSELDLQFVVEISLKSNVS